MSREIDFSTVTACGECCVGCKKKESGICKGCIEADGFVPEWKESGQCRVHKCAKSHGVSFCGICSEFPCEQLPIIIHWDPDRVEHLRKLGEQYRAQKKAQEEIG